MKTIALGSLVALSLAACAERDPVADGANNLAAAPMDVDVLPPDESVATPTNQLENGAAEPVDAAAPGKIPASLHGRWGMTPADCSSTRGDAKGLLLVSNEELRFYESVARPARNLEASADSVRGDFAFTGEGQQWTRFQSLQLRRNDLVRTETDPARSYTYVRCRPA